MALSTALVGTYFTSGRLTLALSRGTHELVDAGYRRATPQWRISDDQARTTVAFGPFVSPVAFDTLVILEGDQEIDRVGIGAVAVPAGTAWDQTLAVRVDG